MHYFHTRLNRRTPTDKQITNNKQKLSEIENANLFVRPSTIDDFHKKNAV